MVIAPSCTDWSEPRFVASTEELDSGAPVVSVMGEVDLATAPALEQTLLDVAEDRTGEVIVDLTGCSFLDSRGLRALVAARARLERSNRQLALVLSNPSVLRIFQITRVRRAVRDLPLAGRGRRRQRQRHGTAMASWREQESETQARSREDNESTARPRASDQPTGG